MLWFYESFFPVIWIPRALAVWHLVLLDWSCYYRRRPSLRSLGTPAPRQQLESLRNHQAGSRADYHRPLCPCPSPHLHRHSGRVSWHRDCAFPGARGHRFRPGIPCVLGQVAHGGEVDAFPIRGDVCQLCPADCRPGAVPFLIAMSQPPSRARAGRIS
jgi:hypothetical protein